MNNVIAFSWAAVPKWAVRDSGDAVVVNAMHANRIVALIVDVQGTGSGASKTAWSLAALGSQLAGEGADAVSIASLLNRALWSRRGARVQASLGVLLWEPDLGATSASYGSVLVLRPESVDQRQSNHAPAAGIDVDARPTGVRHPQSLESLVMCSDGIATSSDELRSLLEVETCLRPSASNLLERAVARDRGRPRNDMTVVVLSAVPGVATGSTTVGELSLRLRAATATREVADATSSDR